MNNKFIPLDCDDDVVLFYKDTFKVSRLKELVYLEIRNKLNQYTYDEQTKNRGHQILTLLHNLSIGQEGINFDEIQFHSVLSCQFLKIGGKGWQKGKIKIQMSSFSMRKKQQPEIYLEFCPDEPEEPESPLDDIRKLIQQAES
ncbi:KGK domain protein [Cylindrospermum stagnale PCC 7417]|uniref:KGK domain protein n=1 Tax=Cylindrospermum stagnale PCC 7417 TaxID=56107 RepID=K9WUF3_9NOST|nr:KGK domain-containing protein [Cylindrospermum stagnale]AFZ24015.1 KGK domain protein [Cylindrospermum stagnale PCC 7417]